MEINATMIDPKDTVAVAIEPLAKGMQATIRLHDNTFKSLRILDDIPIYHKFAVCETQKGMPIVKYGEHIGIAGCDIKIGDYVHIHNVIDCREHLEV